MISRARLLLVSFATIAAVGCDAARPSADAGTSAAPPVPSPTPTPPPVPVPPTDVRVKTAMANHYDAIREIQLGVVHGLLDHAREEAAWLGANLSAPGFEDRATELAAVRVEANALAVSKDLASAALHAARLGGTCGACHVAALATTTFAYEPLPTAMTTLPERMQRHRWAAARLWEGVVGPSSELWRSGAQTLASAPLIADPRLAKIPRAAEVKGLAQKVQRLARTAVGTTDPERRVAVYGELLATCSACHAITWPIVRAK